MVNLDILGFDRIVKLKIQLVVLLKGVRVASEAQAVALDVELEIGRLTIWDGDSEVDEVLCGVGFVGALGPKDY